MELNRIYHGDCLEVMKDIPDGSVDMILCDLPYGTTACKWDAIIPFEPLWEQYERVIKKHGAIVLTASQPFTSALVMSNARIFRYEWVWEKSVATNFLNSKIQPLKKTESVLVFYKQCGCYYPQGLRRETTIRNQRVRTVGKDNAYGKQSAHSMSEITNYPTNIIKIPNGNNANIHPTQKPVALFEYLIRTYTNEGETVLDNCAGSGTTGIACRNTGRNFILIEKDDKYFDVAQRRLEEHAGLFRKEAV